MKKNLVFIFILFLLVFTVDSAKIEFPFPPDPVETEATNLTLGYVSTTKAKLTYQICGKAVTEAGLCYSSSQHPTPGGANTIIEYQGDAIDIPLKVDYKARINGLEQGKDYYARAYVKNKSEEITYSDEIKFTTEKDTINYDAMLNGPKKEYYANGSIMREYNLNDGKVEGEYKFYDDSARLVANEYIKNGLPNGLCRYYYKNGQLSREIVLKDGIQNGPCKEYYMSGEIKSMSNIYGDPPNTSGKIEHYSESGQTTDMIIISFGKLVYHIAYDDKGRVTLEEKDGGNISYSYDRDGWKHTSVNGEGCTCSRCQN